MKENKRTKKIAKGMSIFLIILLVLVVILGGILLYNIINKSRENELSTKDIAEKNALNQNEVSIESDISKKIYEYINQYNCIDAIYMNSDKNLTNNQMILTITCANIDFSNWEYIADKEEYHLKDINLLTAKVKEIFGDIKVEPETFDTKIEFNTFGMNHISFDGDNCYAKFTKQEEKTIAKQILQKLYKVEQFDDRIELIVRSTYLDTEYNDETQMTQCKLYKDYDFSTKQFSNLIKTLSEKEINFEQNIGFYESILNETEINELPQYKYILKRDATSGNYYLSTFEKI